MAEPAGRTVAAGLRPGLQALRRKDADALRGDLVGGLTVAAYLVPQVMAYAVLAGLPPVTGLWAAVGALVLYPFLGTSRLLSVGPESTTAILTAVAVGPLAAGDPARYAALAAGLALAVSVVCALGRLARLGFLADLLSRPVLVGYMAGIAVIMIVGQLGPLTGVQVDGDGPLGELRSLVTGLGGTHLPTLVLSLATLTLLFVGARVAPRLPIPLITVLLAAAAITLLGPTATGIATVGPVPAGLPVPGPPRLGLTDYTSLIGPALGVSVVAFTDVVLTGRAFTGRSHDAPDPDRELLALAGTNIASGMLAGFPVSSSGSRTALAKATGARTQLHSLVALVVVVTVLLVGGDVLQALPRAALGALVVYAAVQLVYVAEFRRIAAFRRSELLLSLATVAAVLGLGVLYGVLVAVGLSVLDLVRRIARPHVAALGFAPGVAGMHDLSDLPGTQPVPGLVVHRYDAPLFFANAEDFRRSVHRAVAEAAETAPVRWVVLDLEAVTELDLTAADALIAVARELAEDGIVLAAARAKRELVADLEAGAVLEAVDAARLYPTIPTAVAAFHAETDPPSAGGAAT
ncbi:SulP family inorganic anion transporter [Pseudonocardia dioxanivorans]|uniref:SulP family inorganic anion transporter n=1 Tax=Pseudonocardia dioxanivorans TaxID=240495 RepID=UPI000CD0984B|nr:SulP family inorganic anion transporter [Pseudonocardia dioxanivorans]